MRYCHFQHDGESRFGLIESVAGVETIVRTLKSAPRTWAQFEGAATADLALSSVRLLAPAAPSKIVCVVGNSGEHAKELTHPIPTEPLIFLKPPSSVVGPMEE